MRPVGALSKKLEAEVGAWQHVFVAPHQFAAREFRFQNAEIGHVHLWGDVDIPFPRAVHDVLLAERRAQRHRWLPDSGWVRFHLGKNADVEPAIWLMRLSYLRYAMKAADDAPRLLEEEAMRLNLSGELTALMRNFLPRKFSGLKTGSHTLQNSAGLGP
ncbi:MAG TPA: luciferase family protein [Terracidiphilus sp.]